MTNESVTVEDLIGHRDFVRRLARSLVRDPETAEDVAQQAYAAALANPPRSRAAATGWLASVVRRLSARSHRDRYARERREAAAARPEELPSTAAVLEREEVRRRLVRAVLALDEPYRSVVLLRWFEEAPPREIARRLGVPVETVRTRLKRAHARLRTRMDREADGRRDAWAVALLPLAQGVMMGTKTKLLLAAAALVLLVGGAFWASARGGPAPKPRRTESLVAAAPVPPPVVPEDASAPPAPASYVVRGRVVDEEERGVPDIEVWLSVQRPGGGGGKRLRTAEDGTFQAQMEDDTPVLVVAIPAPHFEPDRESRPVVTPPAESVVLRGTRFPVGTVVVRVIDARTGAPLPRAQVMVSQPVGGWVGGDAPGEDREIRVRFPPDRADAVVTVRLTWPKTPKEVSRQVSLPAGGRVAVELVLPASPDARRIVGRVVSSTGDPIEGARVYAGGQMRMRGDEPFKPFRIDRVPDAVKTDANGSFDLDLGDAERVTVWHPDYSPVTVPANEAENVVLLPRATLHGRILDDAGNPLAGVAVALDRDRKATTDEDGRFSFEKVEAGVRGLILPGRYLAVRVRPGEDADVTIPAGLPEVTVSFLSGGAPFAVPAEARQGGLLLGLDRVGGVYPLRVKPGDTKAIAEHVLPGRYLLLLSSGHVTTLEIDSADAAADFGTADLTIEGPPKTPVWVLPAGDAGELARLLAGRAVFLDLPESGKVRLAPLPRGRWLVGVDETTGDGARRPGEKTVEVSGTGATVTLGNR